MIEGNREGFGPKGPLECNSEQLLMATGEGAVEKVQEMLKTNLVSADVADRHGHTALIGASVSTVTLSISALNVSAIKRQ